MDSAKNFQEKSYEQHAGHFQEYSQEGEKSAHAKTWFAKDTVDAWRHRRMYQTIDPILMAEPKAKWLTVGDGRYGNDAKYILDKGCNALASDISDTLLEEAKEAGYISEYKKENAEALSFKDSDFDYAFCKEAYHHFPRPMLALYEMLRVANKGVVLIEPNDFYVNSKISEILFRNLRVSIKLLLQRKENKHDFEESGNYVYCISRREIEKVALGLNYKVVAFKGTHDMYFEGVEYEKLSDDGPLQKKVRKAIKFKDLLCRFGLTDYGLITAIIFKQKPSQELIRRLTQEGYEITNLPDNPYISAW